MEDLNYKYLCCAVGRGPTLVLYLWVVLYLYSTRFGLLYSKQYTHRSLNLPTLLRTMSQPGWNAWRAGEAPIPQFHPTKGRTQEHCRHGFYRVSGIEQQMCLVPKDTISNRIASRAGVWDDCARLTEAFSWASALLNISGTAPLFLDVGANIGACTVEMLLKTPARVVAFEPSPFNLYHLTRSLNMLPGCEPGSSKSQRVRCRDVTVFPLGAGDRAYNDTIFTQANRRGDGQSNQGNSVVGLKGDRRDFIAHELQVRPLDTIFPELPHTPLMKLDVQGFECRVLEGAHSLLRSGRIHAISLEVSSPHQAPQGCNRARLRALLEPAGYRVSFMGTVRKSASGAVTEDGDMFAVRRELLIRERRMRRGAHAGRECTWSAPLTGRNLDVVPGGALLTCQRRFITFELAKAACERLPTCGGVTQDFGQQCEKRGDESGDMDTGQEPQHMLRRFSLRTSQDIGSFKGGVSWTLQCPRGS